MLTSQWKGYIWAILSLLLSSFAQILMKLAMFNLPPLYLIDWHWLIIYQINIAWLVLGVSAYAISLLTWLNTLHYLPLTRAYPLLSLSYILVYLAAINLPVLHETDQLIHWFGIGLIILGVGLISWPTSNVKIIN